MSFLDNIENSLKNLESSQENDPAEAHRARQKSRAQAAAIAPWAEKLKSSAFVEKLMNETVTAGRTLRSKIYMAWMEATLRLEAKGHACEIRPTPKGIEAQYRRLSDGSEKVETVDLKGDPKALLDRWLFEG